MTVKNERKIPRTNCEENESFWPLLTQKLFE